MNIPQKGPSGSVGKSVNPKVTDMILGILNSLKNKPENKNEDNFKILKKFLNDYSISGDHGLLEEISKTGDLNFDMIKDDGFDIKQIIGEDKNTSSIILHNILNDTRIGTIGKDIEKIVISKLIKKIRDNIPEALKEIFDKELDKPGNLNEFKSKLRNFFEYGGIDENIKHTILEIKITNKDIVDGMVDNGTLQVSDIAGNYKNWNASHKKGFDKIITQEYLDGLRDSANFVEKNIDMVKDVFTNFIPNMGMLLDKYPYNMQQIKDNEPHIAEKIIDLEKRIANGENVRKEWDKLRFYAYTGLVGKSNQKLGKILAKLLDNNFDYNKLNKEEQNEILIEILDLRLSEMDKIGISELIGTDKNNFNNFIRDVFDINKQEVSIPCVGGDIKLSIKKNFKGVGSDALSDISTFMDNRLPLEFDIEILEGDKDILNNTILGKIFFNELSDDKKHINLDTGNIGKLLMMYVMGITSFNKKDMSSDKVEQLKKAIDLMDHKNNLNNELDDKKDIDNNHNKIDQSDDIENKNPENKTPESVENPQEQFMEARKGMKGYDFAEDQKEFGFVEGTRLWIKFEETELPPVDSGGDQWVELEIKDIGSNDFTVVLHGGELSAGDIEGKTIRYPKKRESLDTIINGFNGDVYKLPKPAKWEKTLGNIVGSGLSNLGGIGVFEDIKYEDGKFISIIEKNDKNKGKEITHFGNDEKTYDEQGKEKVKPVFYKITHNNNGTITVEYENYKREMDYNNFIIFISTKNLKPATKEHVEEVKANYDNEATAGVGKRKRQFFGVSNIIGAIKGVGKKVNDALKKFNEERTDAFNEFLVSDFHIFQKLTNLTSFIPGVGDALQGVELEYYNERDAKTRKKIEKRVKLFEADPDFGTTFEQKGYLGTQLGGGSLQDMVVNCKMPKDRYIAAATLLALISKGKSPYRSIQGLRMKGAWVKLLLGEGHHKRFMEHQKQLIRKIENEKGIYGPGYDSPMINDLVKAEMTYLINNIGQRYGGTGALFGALGPEAKLMRSDKFSSELESKYNDFAGVAKAEEALNGMKTVTSFNLCYIDFKKNAGSGRAPGAFACLKKMSLLAKSPQQKSIVKMCILGGMLNGFFLNFADKDTKIWLQSIFRSRGFTAGFWVVDYNQKEKIAYVLDFISKGNFSKKLGYNPNNFGIDAAKIDFGGFFGKFEGWWNEQGLDGKSNGTDISDFLKKLSTMESYNGKKINEDTIMSVLKGMSIESQVEGTDKDVDTNSKVITDSPLSQTKGLVQLRMMKYNNGSFAGEIDQIQAAEDFWNGVSKDLPKSIESKNGQLMDVAKIYFNRFDGIFDEGGKIRFIKRLASIQKYRKKMGGGKVYEQEGGGQIEEDDLKKILWYSTTGEICRHGKTPPPQFMSALTSFFEIFWNNIDNRDKSSIGEVFGKEYLSHFDKPYYMAPRKEYNNLFGGSDVYDDQYDFFNSERDNERGLNKEQKQRKSDLRRELRNENVFLNKNMKDMEKDLSRKGILCPSLGKGAADIKEGQKILGYD